MGASPARLVIALSVAAALAIFVVYTALAGSGIAQVTPSTVTSGKVDVNLVGKVVGHVHQTSNGLRFRVKDISGRKPARVLVAYSGSVPSLFKTGSDLIVEGTMRNGVFVAMRNSLTTKCPDHYSTKSSSNT